MRRSFCKARLTSRFGIEYNGRMPDTIIDTDALVNSTLAPALERAEAKLQEAQDIVKAIEAERNRIRAAIRELTGGKTATPKRKANPAPPRSDSTGFGIALSVAKVAAAQILTITNDGQDPFTQKDLYKSLDWDQSKGSQAVRYLREIEFLRKVGRDEQTGRELWAVMDADALDRVLEEQAMAERLRFAKPNPDSEDKIERAAAYLQAMGEVEGWDVLAEAANYPETQTHTVRRTLLDAGVIKTEGGRGQRTRIIWIGE